MPYCYTVKIDVQLKMMAISLETLISGFFPHSESAGSKVVPISKEEAPSSDKPIDLNIFLSHGEIFDRFGVTPDDLLKAKYEGGITKCPTRYGNLYVHWGTRAIAPSPECYSAQKRSSILKTD